MNEIVYLIYDCGFRVAGFTSLEDAVWYAEHRGNLIEPDLVDAKMGEVIDTYIDGAWENGG